LPTSPAAKLSLLTVSPLHYALITPALFHSPAQAWGRFSMAERSPPPLSLHTLHCLFLL
jgi:hypothetical protein